VDWVKRKQVLEISYGSKVRKSGGDPAPRLKVVYIPSESCKKGEINSKTRSIQRKK